MKQPTEQEIKEFWEWCGFKLSKTKSPDPIYELNEPSGEQYNIWYAYRAGTNKTFDNDAIRALYPTVNLNSLFRYAVPKLAKGKNAIYFDHPIDSEKYCCLILDDDGQLIGDGAVEEDPALALFWAIKQVMNGGRG